MNARVGMLVLAAAMMAGGVQAESITHGSTTINMNFVDIGFAGNLADTADGDHFTGGVQNYGAVGYNYRIGTYEVTVSQWDAVRAADSNVGNAEVKSGSQPTARSSWYEAAKFANWLTTGNAYDGAYQFNVWGILQAVDRDAAVSAYGTVYVLPSEDEWYKAAYLKSDGSAYTLYATGDSIPTAGAGGQNYNYSVGTTRDVGSGIPENNGTFDMGGNVSEWNESASDGTLDNMAENRVARGGSFSSSEISMRSSYRADSYATYDFHGRGFRVAAIPEPSSIAMIGLVSGCAVLVRRRFMI